MSSMGCAGSKMPPHECFEDEMVQSTLAAGTAFLDRYALGEELGSGSCSVVRACTRRADGAEFAVKVVDTTDWSQAARDGLTEKCRHLTELRHPNIVATVEMVREGEKMYLVTERCVGGELVDRIIEREHFTEADARETVLLVLEAVHYCHEQGIVHHGMKLENVLLTSTEPHSSIKLVDFGFSIHADHEGGGTLAAPCGTLRFCAPEVLSGRRCGKGVDVWGMGCIAYALLAGFPPFLDDNDAALAHKIKFGELSFDFDVWGAVSDTAKAVVMQMLTVEPTQRPTTTELLQHEWFTAQAEGVNSDRIEALRGGRSLRSLPPRIAMDEWDGRRLCAWVTMVLGNEAAGVLGVLRHNAVGAEVLCLLDEEDMRDLGIRKELARTLHAAVCAEFTPSAEVVRAVEHEQEAEGRLDQDFRRRLCREAQLEHVVGSGRALSRSSSVGW